ncbi:MAG: hypothetical protein R6W77_05635 [Trueperaceae bacterium]
MNVAANPVYQAVVEELEELLSPRIVSRSLKEGLRQQGRSPDTVDVATIEVILKAQVYRQLQVTMPVTQAKDAVTRIVDRLRDLEGQGEGAGGGYSLAAQEQELERLQAALRPFNLYFEWPEVQKLRAQIQLLEAEHEAGRESYVLAQDAAAQYELVVQKLEDQLVLQARELGELDEALEQVRSLGGAKVRRLETVVNQVRAAQENRQLAPAEIERARRLARELRKLMESSVYAEKRGDDAEGAVMAGLADDAGATMAVERVVGADDVMPADGAMSAADGFAGAADAAVPEVGEPAAASADAGAFPRDDDPHAADAALAEGSAVAGVGGDEASSMVPTGDGPSADEGVLDVEAEEEDLLSIDTIDLDPEAHERIRMIDIAGELQDLALLESEYAQLLAYRHGLGQRVEELRAELEAGRSVADVLRDLRADFEATTLALRDDLREELSEITSALDDWPAEVDTSELAQAAKVTLGILSTALPSLDDVNHVRQLHQLAREQAEAVARAAEVEAEQLQQQEEFLHRLEDTLVRYQAGPTPAEQIAALRQELDALRLAHEQRSVVPDVVASARQVEERLARDLAERATEASERRRARLDALRAQLEGLPVTNTMSDRAGATLREIDRLMEAELSSAAASALLLDEPPDVEHALGDTDPDVDAVASVVEELRRALASSIRVRLQALSDEAAAIGSKRLLERIHLAMRDLEEDRYPDLAQLQGALQQEREAQRLDQVGELHRLTRDATPFQASAGEEATRLRSLLAEAARELEAGSTSERLQEAAGLLERLERDAEARLGSVPRRLDAALATFAQVAKLNSEDVATARRILTHLDSQRDALERVSLGLQLQLEASLRHAETLLDKLTEEYEATRVIADQLVSEGLLDDVLGVFDGVTGTSDAAATAFGGTTATAAASEGVDHVTDLAILIERYVDQEGVTGAALVDHDGQVLAGRLPFVARGLAHLFQAAQDVITGAEPAYGEGANAADASGPEANDPDAGGPDTNDPDANGSDAYAAESNAAGGHADATRPRLLQVETDRGVTLIALLPGGSHAVVTVSSPAHAQGVANRLRRDVARVPNDRP